MAIAGIGGQRDTLMSRSIVIGLRRRLPNEPVDRLPFDLHAQLLRIRCQIARWAEDNAGRIAAMLSEPPDCGDDRRRDNWTPLHRIAAALGGAWPDRIASAYAAQAKAQDEDTEPAGVMMLGDLAEIFAGRRVDRIASSELVGDLLMLEERPWAEWRHGRPITAQSVAKLLKPFGVKVHVLKLNGAPARVYLRTEIEAAAARYTPRGVTP
jgi:putative DNA primase/helicase